MSSKGTCCGCFNFRQGAVFAVALGMVVSLLIVCMFSYLAFDPLSITQYFIKQKVLGNGSVAIFLYNGIVPLSILGVLTNMNFNSGTATKLLALLLFIGGLFWVGFGGLLARRLSVVYREGTLTGQFMKNMIKDPNAGKHKLRSAGLFIGAISADSFATRYIMDMLPFPLNYMYWMGMWPVVPFLIFGLLPAMLTFMGIGPLMSLAGVMDAGGDGTEYVEASKIHWFYSLNPDDRNRVREGSDLEGGNSSDSDSDIERRPLSKPRVVGPVRHAAAPL